VLTFSGAGHYSRGMIPKFLISHHAQERVQLRASIPIREEHLVPAIYKQVIRGWSTRWEIVDLKGQARIAIAWPEMGLFLILSQNGASLLVLTALADSTVITNVDTGTMVVIRKHDDPPEAMASKRKHLRPAAMSKRHAASIRLTDKKRRRQQHEERLEVRADRRKERQDLKRFQDEDY